MRTIVTDRQTDTHTDTQTDRQIQKHTETDKTIAICDLADLPKNYYTIYTIYTDEKDARKTQDRM